MRIVICDDDIIFAKKLYEGIVRVCDELGEKGVQVLSFSCGEDFFNYYEQEKRIDIILLDIMMKNVNGIEVAKAIRLGDANMEIIFLTSLKNYVFEGYNLRATNYLLKPINYLVLKKEIEKAIENIKRIQNAYFVEKNDLGVFKIYADDIRFIETYMRNTKIHLKDESVLSYKSMKKHMQELEQNDFYRIHESYIVNMKYIKKVVGYEVVLTDETVLPMGKSRKKQFMESLNYFLGKYI